MPGRIPQPPAEAVLVNGLDRDPALIQPLRRQAPQVQIDLDAPFRAEMIRLLADAGTAGRALLEHIPLRGMLGVSAKYGLE